MDHQSGKKKAAQLALSYIEEGMVLGIGSGTTVDCFIEALAAVKNKIEGIVPASLATAEKVKALSIPLLDLNVINELTLYVDGADEINAAKQMIKGGGGALTREKIIATVAQKFICIVDKTKQVDLLGQFPVAVEVMPMARSYVARQIVKLGGDPVYRQGFLTDNQNVILDIYNLKLLDPAATEQSLNNIVGVVENGIFARRTADIVLVG